MSESNKFAYIASILKMLEATSFERIKTVKKWTGMQNKHCNGVCRFNSSYLKYSLRELNKWKFSSCFCSKGNRYIASMEVESLGSLNFYILIILDLLR